MRVRAGIMRVVASPAVFVPSSGTIRRTLVPGLRPGHRVAGWPGVGKPSQGRPALPLPFPALGCGGAARPSHGDLPWLCPEPGEPNTSFKSWLAATPAMTIIEPMATYCKTIARRSLLQFFDIIWAWGPRS